MKKFKFTIHGNNYNVELQDIEDNVAEIEVNGSKYKVEIHAEEKTKPSKTPRLVRKETVPSADTSKAKTSKPTAKAGAGSVRAPLPGTILTIKVRPGDVVKSGDEILVMEAMKMENSIKADKEGKITELKVKEGDAVMEGDILAEIGS